MSRQAKQRTHEALQSRMLERVIATRTKGVRLCEIKRQINVNATTANKNASKI